MIQLKDMMDQEMIQLEERCKIWIMWMWSNGRSDGSGGHDPIGSDEDEVIQLDHIDP